MVRNERLNVTVCYALYEQIIQGVQLNAEVSYRPTQTIYITECSLLGIATHYGLDGTEIRSRLGQSFPHPIRPALGPIQLFIEWVPGDISVLRGHGKALTTLPHLAPRLRKEQSYTATPPLGLHDMSQSDLYLYPFSITYRVLQQVLESTFKDCKT